MHSEDEFESEWDDEVYDSAGEEEDDLCRSEDDMLPCPACGVQVYDDTDQCPHCGEWIMPLAASGRANLTVMLVVIVMIALLVMLVLL